jgi:hypothetical protein
MARPRSIKLSDRLAENRRRPRPSFAEVLRAANQRAHDKANRRIGKRGQKSIQAENPRTLDQENRRLDKKRGQKSIQAAIASSSPAPSEVAEGEHEFDRIPFLNRLMRWIFGLILVPFGVVTTFTFFGQFSQAAIDRDFWQTSEFWYFATGALVMGGWFFSGLLQSVFLYLYVLGHELTHAMFVYLFCGKVTEMHVSLEGGYITTNKTNLIIALSPYFVPFWSVVAVAIFMLFRHTTGLPVHADKVLFAATGVTWTFHFVWTLWMIPRDQPDLKENGTFFSLVVIYLANLLVMALLLCLASESPWQSARDFAHEWIRHAAVGGEIAWRWIVDRR